MDATAPTSQQQEGQHGGRNAVAGVAAYGAAFLLIVVGTLGILQGIAALLADDVLVVSADYSYRLSLTGWGWVHLIVGTLMALAALGLLDGAYWARMTAIVLAAVSIVANFLWLPYYPWWAILVIAIDLVVIWAVATWPTSRIGKPASPR